jgi:hypothetical protein
MPVSGPAFFIGYGESIGENTGAVATFKRSSLSVRAPF